MAAAIRRPLSALVLLAWMAPSVGAVGVGVHVALDHGGPRGAEHRRTIAELGRTAAHGHHHHSEAAPAHEHDARVDGPAPLFKPGRSSAAPLPSTAPAVTTLTAASHPDYALRRGPPVPLFTVHSSPLL